MKEVPGAGEPWCVYDGGAGWGMSQDFVLRNTHKWVFTRYDGLNRPDSTGLITDPSHYNNLSYHENLAAISIFYPDLTSYTTELLTRTFYDAYSTISSVSVLPSSIAT